MKTKEVSFEINRKQEAALTKYSGSIRRYFLEHEVFERLKEILKKRKEKEFEASKADDEIKTENNFIKEELEKHSKILEELLAK